MVALDEISEAGAPLHLHFSEPCATTYSLIPDSNMLLYMYVHNPVCTCMYVTVLVGLHCTLQECIGQCSACIN